MLEAYQVRYQTLSGEHGVKHLSVFSRLAQRLHDPPYYYTIFSSEMDQYKLFHWHMEDTPRFSVIAGLEPGSSIYINTVKPEDACRYLRPDREPESSG